MEIKFTVPGQPKGKQRSRVCRIRGKTITYTPKQTIEYEKLVGASYTAVSRDFFEKSIPLEISILALFPIPKYVKKKTRELMINGYIFPTKKPDGDNIIKAILDVLNGVTYRDDSQVCRIYFEKKYSEISKIEITIKEIVL